VRLASWAAKSIDREALFIDREGFFDSSATVKFIFNYFSAWCVILCQQRFIVIIHTGITR